MDSLAAGKDKGFRDVGHGVGGETGHAAIDAAAFEGTVHVLQHAQ